MHRPEQKPARNEKLLCVHMPRGSGLVIPSRALPGHDVTCGKQPIDRKPEKTGLNLHAFESAASGARPFVPRLQGLAIQSKHRGAWVEAPRCLRLGMHQQTVDDAIG